MKWFLFGILVLVFVLIGGIGWYIKPYFTPAKKLHGLKVKTHCDDTIRIAYVGDSWAVYQQYYNCDIDSIISIVTKRPVKVRISGVNGITSKNVYYSFYRNDCMRELIEWGPDFCFIVAGINDSDRKMGRSYYKENMNLIIETLLKCKIVPILLEIPSYNICYSFKVRSLKVKLQYLASMLITWSKMDCINDYRRTYTDLIYEKGWEKKVITISSNEWNPDGYKDLRGLYDEGLMHLNEKGYHVLDSCIAHNIIDYLGKMQ